MNEIQLIRNQLALERAHASAVANACAAVLPGDTAAGPGGEPVGAFRRACVAYLACVLAWFEERDQRVVDLLQKRFGAADPARRAFEEVLARPGRSRDALAKLEAACGGPQTSAGTRGPQAWSAFSDYFNGVWSTRREALDALLASSNRAADWRALAGIDADSILEERRRYAMVVAQAPPGVTLDRARGG
ncbi:MAG TPA: hypothetical protein VMT66_08065 [Steroidobacteraceae bacterium]|nr:hypothetical protein [Steroidobacteraceae bacterium]